LHHCIVLKKSFTLLKPSTHIKINFKKLLQHVSVPLDHHQGARRSYPKVITGRLLVRYTVVLRQQHAAAAELQ
jgi:hypothetical protein